MGETGGVIDPLLICGGGIGGLSAAIALAREGIAVQVLEQSKTFREAGAGIELGPNATRQLEAWGIAEPLATHASRPEGIRIYDGLSGDLLNTVPLGAYVRERFGGPYLVIHRKHLQQCLLQAANDLDGLDIRTGFAVSRMRVDEAGVEAESRSGDKVRGCGLIGADGLWSKIRSDFTADEPRPSGVTAWRSLLPVADAPALAAEPYIGLWLGPDSHVIHYSVDGGAKLSVVAMISETVLFDGWASKGDAADLLPFFQAWDDEVFELLEKPADWYKWTVMQMDPLARWGAGPVTLLGDAAHPIVPFMAQGGATAIEDAASLAIAVAANRDDIPTAFRDYEQSRIARATRIQKASLLRGRVYHMSNPMRWARNQLLRRQTPERLLKHYDWLYGFSG